jgi:hypothetical protein
MYEHKYNIYGDVERYYEGYWDSKLNHIYYNQSKSKRAWLQFKKVCYFYWDIFPLWGILGFACVFYNAKTTANKTNVTSAVSIIK